MKIRRYKKVSKHLNFYMHNFQFRQPYQILIDGTFCFTALNNKINIEDNIPRYLQGEIKFLTTQCVYVETENLGKKVFGALLILKKFPIHKCGHEGKPIPGAKCLLSMVKEHNKNHYIIASQDMDLQSKLRGIPGVPLLYLHQKTPVLEQPSEASMKHAKNMNGGLGEFEKETIANLKSIHGIIEEEQELPKRRKKKKGPNPLSCKKKQKKPSATEGNNINSKTETNTEAEKKRRKKIRIPKHVKDELIKSVNK